MGNRPEDLNAEARAEKALRLRSYGMRWAAVAHEAGYPSANTAEKAVERLRARTREAAMVDYRYFLGERLADMAAIIRKRIDEGDLWAYDRMLAITEQQRKLFGADAATEADRNATPYAKRITLHTATSDAPPSEPQEAA